MDGIKVVVRIDESRCEIEAKADINILGQVEQMSTTISTKENNNMVSWVSINENRIIIKIRTLDATPFRRGPSSRGFFSFCRLLLLGERFKSRVRCYWVCFSLLRCTVASL